MPHLYIINDWKIEVPYCYQNKNGYVNLMGIIFDNKFDSTYNNSRDYILLKKNITQMILMFI